MRGGGRHSRRGRQYSHFACPAEIKDYQHSQTPLHIACASKDEERVLILLDAGCDVHATDGVGRSPLGVAILNKFYRVVPLLLEYGASLNDTDRSMLSPALQQYLDQQRGWSCDSHSLWYHS